MIAGPYHNPGFTAASIGAADATHSHALADLPVAGSGEASAAKLVRADDERLDGGGVPEFHTHELTEVTGLVEALAARPLLATVAPAPLATLAQVGAAATAARADHVHPLPSVAEVGIAAAQLWQTGDYKHTAAATAAPGWLFADGRTIGAAGSGATSRADADTQALYTLLHDAYPDAILPVTGGRGADAGSDFAAGKTIALPDLRGRGLFGWDAMGGVAAGRITDVGTGNPGIAGATLGASGGADRHTLTAGQGPVHQHVVPGQVTAGGGSAVRSLGGAAVDNVNSNPAGGGEAHPQMPPALICSILIKL